MTQHHCVPTGYVEEGPKRKCRKCKAASMRWYRGTNPNYAEASRERFAKIQNTPMELAKRRVYIEVRAARMPRANTLTCLDCQNSAECYAHTDYARPLAVEPVCRSCNKKRGPVRNSQAT